MPASPERYDRLPAGVTPGQMKRILVGFGARVTKKHAGERTGAQVDERFGQGLAKWMRHCRGIEQQLGCLLTNRSDDAGVTMAGRGYGVTAVCVEPLIPILVDEPRSAAACGADGELGIDLE